MKKHLLSTSAIALGVAAAAPASAAEWDLSWGGYFTSIVGFADVSDDTGSAVDFDGFGILNDGEIIFSPSITLDNGLTFGANVQFEAQNSSAGDADVDESYLSVSGDNFGRLLIGGENSAGYLLSLGAPQVTPFYIGSPSISAFIPVSNAAVFSFRQASTSPYTEVGGNNDSNRITYFTPDFNGFTAGFSYAGDNEGSAPNFFDDAGAGVNGVSPGSLEDIFDIGLAYNGSFGTTDVALSARWGTADVADSTIGGDVDTWALGANVTFGAVTVGGSYAENDNSGLGGGEQEGWSFGVTYDAAGPWSFEAQTYQGEADGAEAGNIGGTEYTAYQIGANREVGPGVNWGVLVAYAEGDDEDTAGTDVDGTLLATYLSLGF